MHSRKALRLACNWQVAKGGTRVKHVGELKSHSNYCTTGQNFQSNQAVSTRLKLVTRSSREAESPEHPVCQKPDSSHSIHTLLYTLIPIKCRELPERILREKPKRKTRLTHPQSSSFVSLNSSTLTLSINTSLRGTLAKILISPYHICEKVIWCLGSSSEGTNSFWLMQWVIAGSSKLKKTRFVITLLEQEAQRAWVHWVDQAWRVFCYSCIPTIFPSGLLTAWRAVERFYAKDFNFLFDNTSLCCLCVCISLSLIFAF